MAGRGVSMAKDQFRAAYKTHCDEAKHKLFLRSDAASHLSGPISVLDFFGGEGRLLSWWLDRGAVEAVAVEKNAARFEALRRKMGARAAIIHGNSLDYARSVEDADRFNVFELDASGMANNWIMALLGKRLTGRKLFAVTDGGQLAFRSRAQIRPGTFCWSLPDRTYRLTGNRLLHGYVALLRGWWEELAGKQGFQVVSWKIHRCKPPKATIYYCAVVDFPAS